MTTYQFRKPAQLAGVTILVALIAVAAATAVWRGAEAQSAGGSPAAHRDSQLPEVMAVEDITADSSCELVSERYSDEGRTQLLAREVVPCPLGALVHSKPMSRLDAEAAGLRYVILTGDRNVDKAAHRALKLGIGQKVVPNGRTPGEPSQPIEAMSGECAQLPTYFSQSMTYFTYDVGATVMVVVAYQNALDCGYIWITYSGIAFTSPPYPGEDLYWDQQYYTVPASSWEMGCKRVATWPWQGYEQVRYVAANATLTDETINDTSFWCDWWGEEYTSSMVLYN